MVSTIHVLCLMLGLTTIGGIEASPVETTRVAVQSPMCTDRQLAELGRCGVNDLLFVIFPRPGSHSTPPHVHFTGLDLKAAWANNQDTGDKSQPSRIGVDALCSMYVHYTTCVHGYGLECSVPGGAMMMVNIYFDFICKMEKEGFKNFAACLADMKNEPDYSGQNCQKTSTMSSTMYSSILTDINVDDWNSTFWVMVTQMVCYMHNIPAYKACVLEAFLVPCGKNATQTMMDLFDYLKIEVLRLLPRIDIKHVKCDDNDGNGNATTGEKMEQFLDSAGSLADICVSSMAQTEKRMEGIFGVCHPINQLLKAGRCACETLQHFSPGGPARFVTMLDVVDHWCQSGIALFETCVRQGATGCTPSVTAHMDTFLSQFCQATHTAKGLDVCRVYPFLEEMIYYKGACGLSLIVLWNVHPPAGGRYDHSDYKYLFEKWGCLAGDLQDYMTSKVLPKCGPDVTNSFNRSLQGLSLLSDDIWNTVKSVFNMLGKISSIQSRNAGL